MANRRIELHEKLAEILGNRNVYFQPPEGQKIYYPCVMYERSKIDSVFADDKTYLGRKLYTLILIYEDPDSELPEKLLAGFSYIRNTRNYQADNLNHDVFELYW